jgi:hypothetical protein
VTRKEKIGLTDQCGSTCLRWCVLWNAGGDDLKTFGPTTRATASLSLFQFSSVESRQYNVFPLVGWETSWAPPARDELSSDSHCTLYNVIRCWLTNISRPYHNISRCLRHSSWFSLVAVVRKINRCNKLLPARIILNMYDHPRLVEKDFSKATGIIYLPQKRDRNSSNFLFCLRV